MSQEATELKTAVVVGGGVAGTSCALHLHALSPSTSIILIDPKPSLKLCRLLSPVTSTVQETEITEQHAEAWCKQQNITFIRSRAVGLSRNHVTIGDGSRIRYDTCCLATGARPFIPSPLRNPEFSQFVLTLRDTDSVETLRKRLASTRRVLVVGAGGIGMEVVHEISGREVVWVVKGTHVGGLFFDQQIASFIRTQNPALASAERRRGGCNNHASSFKTPNFNDSNDSQTFSGAAVGPNWIGQREHATHFDKDGKPSNKEEKSAELGGRLDPSIGDTASGINSATGHLNNTYNVISECEVVELKPGDDQWAVNVTLSNMTTMGCDLIVVGTGVTANAEWTQDCGLEYGEDGGILVRPNEMNTNVSSSLFAAGDCTRVAEDTETDWVQVRTWGQALAGGRAAANGMAKFLGIPEENVGMGLEFEVFAHSTRFFGHRVVLLGRWKAQGLSDGFKIIERSGDTSFVRVVLENGRVRGAVLVGDVDNAEVFENLIVGQMNVEWMGEDIVDEDIDLENYFD